MKMKMKIMIIYIVYLLLLVGILFLPIQSQIIPFRLIFPNGSNTTPVSKMKGKVRMVSNISSMSGELFEKIVEQYNKENNIESSTEYFTGEEHRHSEIVLSGPSSKVLFSYDKSKLLIETTNFNGNGEMRGITKYFYDSDNWVIRGCGYGADETLKNETLFSYDKIQKQITTKSTNYYEFGTLEDKTIFLYNNKNRITKRINLDEKGKPKRTTDFKYDVHGNVIKEVVDEYVYTYRYWFDKKRNWIKRIKYFHLKREAESEKRENIITIRKIEYY